jgi:hypothetical protein
MTLAHRLQPEPLAHRCKRMRETRMMDRWWLDDEPAAQVRRNSEPVAEPERSAGGIAAAQLAPAAPIVGVIELSPVERVTMLLEQLFIVQPGPVADMLDELRRCNTEQLARLFSRRRADTHPPKWRSLRLLARLPHRPRGGA